MCDEFFGKVAELMMTENISRHKRKRLIIFITVITLLSTVTTTVAWFSVNTFAGVDNLNFSICASAQLKVGMENYGTEIDGLDYVLARKVFRKFEALNLSYIRDEIDGLLAYLDELFGEENMNECKDYLKMLKKLV
ncbi:hypothetical protein [Ruminococcus sp.]|uniref:hypothetical protein n=1 Tax=Ruminococcus sp. TaxID=41978 RepID=UPI003F8207A2